MNIVATEVADIGIIGPLWEKLHEHNNALHKRYFGRELSEKWDHKSRELIKKAREYRIKFDVVKFGAEIVGFCISGIDKHLQGEIVSIYVLPEFRGKGVGTELLNEHLGWLKQNKAASIFLYVHPCNIEAIRFYWRFGFFSSGPLMELCEMRVS